MAWYEVKRDREVVREAPAAAFDDEAAEHRAVDDL
jgi:hypothetical protein